MPTLPNLADDQIIEICLKGQKLYGDDFTPEQIARWYADEKEGYAELGAKDKAHYRYYYHASNRIFGYSHLPDTRFSHALGIGSAYGDEFEPIADRLDRVTILEPSQQLKRDSVFGVPATWTAPDPSGTIPFRDGTFDLVTCLMVLHHIPNVSYVVSEFSRVLSAGGYALISEPVTSMGDWRRPRGGLTKHERGLPPQFLSDAIQKAGFEIVACTRHSFRPWIIVASKLKLGGHDVPWVTRVDSLLSKLFAWNTTYHPKNILHRFRPVCEYYVLRKP